MAKRNRTKKNPPVTVVQELFVPNDFIQVEHLRPGDLIQGTTLVNNVRHSAITKVKKVVPPSRDYLYFIKRFTETNLVVFVLAEDNQVIGFNQNEKIPIIRND